MGLLQVVSLSVILLGFAGSQQAGSRYSFGRGSSYGYGGTGSSYRYRNGGSSTSSGNGKGGSSYRSSYGNGGSSYRSGYGNGGSSYRSSYGNGGSSYRSGYGNGGNGNGGSSSSSSNGFGGPSSPSSNGFGGPYYRSVYGNGGTTAAPDDNSQGTTVSPDDNSQENTGSETEGCVTVQTKTTSGYGYKSTSESAEVATCDFVQSLNETIQAVNDSLSTIEEDIVDLQNDTANLQQDINDLRDCVDELKEDDGIYRRIFVRLSGDRRRLCNLYNMAEAANLCQLLGFPHPDPRFLHIRCEGKTGEPCPTTFWKLQQNCYMPDGASLLSCVVEPDEGDTCMNLLYLSCDGITKNFPSFTQPFSSANRQRTTVIQGSDEFTD